MKWTKRGLVFQNHGHSDWRFSSALQPTPLLMVDRIRFFVGFRDRSGTSRIGYVDVDRENPSKVIQVSRTPVLDVGVDGAFDEAGVVPSAVIEMNDRIYLYYAGYQLGTKVRFSVLGGLAISLDFGETFVRYKRVPVFERTSSELLFRVPHTVIYENGMFRFWYGGGDHFEKGQSKTLPVYDVRYLESVNGLQVPDTGKVVVQTKTNEYRIGRPCVVKRGSNYHMFYGYSSEKNPYKLGYASSPDGLSWTRRDDSLGLDLSVSGWDSEMMAYPALVQTDRATYLFYNGNNYGGDGFGYASLDGELECL